MHLVLDSSGHYLVCALFDGKSLVAQAQHENGTPLSRDIATAVRGLLGKTSLAEIREVIVGLGPGAFIGTRVAVSYANGIAAAAGVKLRGVDSVAAMAAAFPGKKVIALRDARRDHVYMNASGDPTVGTQLVGVDDIPGRLAAIKPEVLFWEQPPAVIHSNRKPSRAWEVVRLLELPLETGPVVPVEALYCIGNDAPGVEYLEPVYLRGYL